MEIMQILYLKAICECKTVCASLQFIFTWNSVNTGNI